MAFPFSASRRRAYDWAGITSGNEKILPLLWKLSASGPKANKCWKKSLNLVKYTFYGLNKKQLELGNIKKHTETFRIFGPLGRKSRAQH